MCDYKNINDMGIITKDELIKKAETLFQSTDPNLLYVATMFYLIYIIIKEDMGYSSLTNTIQTEILSYIAYENLHSNKIELPEIIPNYSGELLNITKQIVSSISFYDKIDDNINKEDFIFKSILTESQIVRGSAYPEQTKEEIINIQGHYENDFTNMLGLGPIKVCKLFEEIVKKLEENGNKLLTYSFEEITSNLKIWDEYIKNKKNHELKDFLNNFKSREDYECFLQVNSINKSAYIYLPISQSDVSANDNEWTFIIDKFGITIEKRKTIIDLIEMKNYPLYVLPDKRILIQDMSNAYDVVLNYYDTEAKKDKIFYEKYQQHKANWTEDYVNNCLNRVFKQENIYRNLSYDDPLKLNGKTELDFLVLQGPFLILLEVKSKKLEDPINYSNMYKLKNDLKKNVIEAYKQIERVIKALQDHQNCKFKEIKTNREIVVNINNYHRIYQITVTQHSLGNKINNLATLEAFNFKFKERIPTALSISDLDVITKFCFSPIMLLHYLERKVSLMKINSFFIGDEIDFFCCYLKNRLKFIFNQDKLPNEVLLTGNSDIIDQFRAYENGELTNKPDISFNIPDEITRIIKEFGSNSSNIEATYISWALLDLDYEQLDMLSKTIIDVTQINKPLDGKLSRLTITLNNITFTIIAGNKRNMSEIAKTLMYRSNIEKYRMKTSKSIGLGIDINNQNTLIDAIVWIDKPWEYDLKLENIIKNEAPIKLISDKTMPGRNDKCFCGSGKKFKKCCLTRIY